MFGKKKHKPSREELEAKLDQIADHGDSEPPIQADEVTGIYDCALARLKTSSEEASEAILDAAKQLDEQTDAVSQCTNPPPREP